MYRRTNYEQIKMEIPFNFPLNEESKWVKLAKIMPWEMIEENYALHFEGNEGQVAKSSRLAFGALYIQSSEGFTDVKVRDHIQDNPHMQYFCGFDEYIPCRPFDASLMVHFRKRIPADMIQKINEAFFKEDCEILETPLPPMEEADEETISSDEEIECQSNKGTLILDATCCPQDIHYPTDMGLLNQARETSEAILDAIYDSFEQKPYPKPRNYRKTAHTNYMAYVKKRKHSAATIRKAIRLQLGYLKRNIQNMKRMLGDGAHMRNIPPRLYRKWLVCAEVYRQQQEMYDTKTHRIDARIVSISQPWVRPIVRGKEGTAVEFGAKVAIGLVAGYAFITDMSWENFSEGKLLEQATEQYRNTFGVYPQAILCDKAYPTRANRAYCKSHGIRISAPKLGRQSDETIAQDRKQLYQDGCDRNAVEGNFGVVKRKLLLSRIMTKLSCTSLTSISMGFFVANMERKLRLLFFADFTSVVFYDFDDLQLVLFTSAVC